MDISIFRFNMIKIITLAVFLAFILFATLSQKAPQPLIYENSRVEKQILNTGSHACLYAKHAQWEFSKDTLLTDQSRPKKFF